MPACTLDDPGLTTRLRHGDDDRGPIAARLSLARLERSLFGESSAPSLGQYEVIRTVASGAMGTVLQARDPRLDRTVAIKVINARSGIAHRVATEALAREARALARLGHPNVVAIHATGTLEPGHPLAANTDAVAVYLVMEYVEGPTLAEWLDAQPRTTDEIVRTFCAAGRGLAAMHVAGLVHRDFKPSNVVVGSDGRVRVVDLGLARSIAAPTSTDASTIPEDCAHDERSAGSTTVAGTPAYMSPEQHRGAAADARSDQFSFCAALLEALGGRRPFPQTSMDELQRAKESGTWARDRTRRLPRHIDRTLRRGLSAHPRDRYASMDALLRALTSDPSPRRRKLVALGIALGLMGGAGTVALADQRARTVDACTDSEAWLGGAWDASTRASLEGAFMGTGVPYAAATWAAVEAEIDRHVAQLLAERRARCEGDLEDAAALGHQVCLDRRVQALRQLVGVLESVDAAAVADAPSAVQALGPAPCGQDGLTDPQSEADPTITVELYRKVARARAEHAAGRVHQAALTARAAAEHAHAVGHQRARARATLVLADARYAQGNADEAAGQYETVLRAARLQDDRMLGVEARLGLGHVRIDQARYDDASRLADRIRGILDAEPGVPGLRARAHHLEGRLHAATGHADLAEAAYERSLSAGTADPIEDRGLRARTLAALGAVMESKADYAAAEQHQREALAVWEQIAGPQHPRTADALTGLALVEMRRGDFESARVGLERALVLRTEAYGETHPMVASTLNNLGSLFSETGEPARALAYHRRALRIRERTLGVEHPKVAQSANNLGTVLLELGDLAGALEQHTRALTLRRQVHGETHPSLGSSLYNVGSVHERGGDLAQAERFYREALRMWMRSLASDHPFVAEAREALGRIATEQGRTSEARAQWLEAERILARAQVEPKRLARIRAHLKTNGSVEGA